MGRRGKRGWTICQAKSRTAPMLPLHLTPSMQQLAKMPPDLKGNLAKSVWAGLSILQAACPEACYFEIVERLLVINIMINLNIEKASNVAVVPSTSVCPSKESQPP